MFLGVRFARLPAVKRLGRIDYVTVGSQKLPPPAEIYGGTNTNAVTHDFLSRPENSKAAPRAIEGPTFHGTPVRYLIVTLALLATAGNAAEPEPLPPSDIETITRKPAARRIPLPRKLRFEPQADMTPQELKQLEPYLAGKPVYPDDEKALGPAMRHLREVK